jgi:hypothetical protein
VHARIEWIGREADGEPDSLTAVFRLINDSPNSIWYFASASRQWPCCTCEANEDGAWTDATFFGCGAVTGVYELGAGETVLCRGFFCSPLAGDEWPSSDESKPARKAVRDRIRVRLDMSAYESMDSPATVQSEPLDPRQLPIVAIGDKA